MPRAGGPLGQRGQLLGDEVVVVDGVRGHAEQTRTRSVPSSLHDVELALGAAQVGRAAGPGGRSRSRGTAGRGRSRGRGRRRGGARRPGGRAATRSGSKISTPSKPAGRGGGMSPLSG